MARIFYHETQHLSRGWLVMLILNGMVCLIIILAVSGWRIDTTMLPVLIGITAVFCLTAWVLVASKLEIEIDETGLRYRYPVFRSRWCSLAKKDIHKVSIENYDAIFEYGGWGYKQSKKHGTVAIIQGDTALKIELASGDRYTIGTQNKEGIRHAMERMMTSTF